MTGLQTNLYPITNLSELSSQYRLYRIRGLRPENDEYHQNLQCLMRKLSYFLKNPVTAIEREGSPYLVVRDEPHLNVPTSMSLVRSTVRLDSCLEVLTLDYTIRSPENDAICLRFLHFLIQEPLYRHPDLWQTAAGQPFFLRHAQRVTQGIEHFRGFSVRAMITPDGGLGLCVDVANRFASQTPLPTYLTRDQFRRWQGKTCIYRNGYRWYEIQIECLDDLNVTEREILEEAGPIPLRDWIIRESAKPIPPELDRLPTDAAVALYHNHRGEERAVPTSLCYPLYDTHSPEGARLHDQTILAAHLRNRLIQEYADSYLRNLRFGDTRLELAQQPVFTPHRMFVVPNLMFGNGQILSVRGTAGAQQVSLDALGQEREALMRSREAGFYVRDPLLERQYLLIPQSIYDTYGKEFIKDLIREVNTMFPQTPAYEPQVVRYDDQGPWTYPVQGRAILQAAEQQCTRPGYAVVMIHPTSDRRLRKEDQLEAMLLRELRRRFDIRVAVIHTEVGQDSYEQIRGEDGRPRYRMHPERRGRLTGYLRGVALNSVLLTNHRWPFALATPLHADLIIGIDVKRHVAGLIIIDQSGSNIRTIYDETRQSEKLRDDQLRSYLLDIIREEAQTRKEPIRTIVIHRDGLLYPSERKGMHEALAILKQEGTISPDAALTILEIPKTSLVPFRLFDVSERNGRRWVDNPQIGSYYIASPDEGYICTTGRAFPHPGTVRPLHVRRLEGPMSLVECLEDIYFLSALAWTRPRDCTRNPITTKLNDRFLGEEAGDYDPDALKFSEDEIPSSEEAD